MSYIFKEWTPNLWLLTLWILSYPYLIIVKLNMEQSILVTISFLLFGWSISFAHKKKASLTIGEREVK